MKLTFSIPAYNEEKNIAKCLEAVLKDVASAGRQNDVEIIVVDNASTDKTAEVAKSFSQVKVVRENKKGLVNARQCGYEHASGDVIACVDSDVFIPAGWTKRVFEEFEADEKLVALSGPHIYYDLPWFQRFAVTTFLRTGYLIHLINHHIFKKGAMLQGGNFIVRKWAMDKIGGHNTDPSIDFYGEDTDIARRISPLGKVKYTFSLPVYTSGRRIKAEGIITMGLKYGINHIWILLFKKPFTKTYLDIRS